MRNWIAVVMCAAVWAGAAEGRTLTLQDAVRLALTHNEEFLIARQEVLRGEERIREGISQALPRLTLDSRYNRSWLLPQFVFDTPEGRQTFTIGTSNNITTGLSFRQTLFSAGKIGAAISVARAFRSYTDAGLSVAGARTVAEVEAAFYDLVLAQETTVVSALAISQAKQNFDRVSSLRGAGRVSDYDVLRAQLRVSELRADSLAAEKQLNLASLALRHRIGLMDMEVVEPAGDFRSETALPLDDLESLVERGLEDRPEVRQMAMELRMRRERIRIERSATLPKLELVASGQYEVQSNDFNFNNDEAQQSWATGLTLTWPLFDGFETKALVGQARVDVRQADLAFSQLKKQVRTEVERAWFEVREGQQRVAARWDGLSEAEEGAKIARTRYAQGRATQLEVLDAELALTRGRTELLRARRDLALALVHLELAVGVNPMAEEEGE